MLWLNYLSSIAHGGTDQFLSRLQCDVSNYQLALHKGVLRSVEPEVSHANNKIKRSRLKKITLTNTLAMQCMRSTVALSEQHV